MKVIKQESKRIHTQRLKQKKGTEWNSLNQIKVLSTQAWTQIFTLHHTIN